MKQIKIALITMAAALLCPTLIFAKQVTLFTIFSNKALIPVVIEHLVVVDPPYRTASVAGCQNNCAVDCSTGCSVKMDESLLNYKDPMPVRIEFKEPVMCTAYARLSCSKDSSNKISCTTSKSSLSPLNGEYYSVGEKFGKSKITLNVTKNKKS